MNYSRILSAGEQKPRLSSTLLTLVNDHYYISNTEYTTLSVVSQWKAWCVPEHEPPPPRAPVVEAGGDGSWSVRALYRMLPPSSDRGECSRPCCLDKAITWS